jgi:hypothetical protein
MMYFNSSALLKTIHHAHKTMDIFAVTHMITDNAVSILIKPALA